MLLFWSNLDGNKMKIEHVMKRFNLSVSKYSPGSDLRKPTAERLVHILPEQSFGLIPEGLGLHNHGIYDTAGTTRYSFI